MVYHRRTATSRLVPSIALLFASSSTWNHHHHRHGKAETESDGWYKYLGWSQRRPDDFWRMDPAVLRQRQRDEVRAQAILLQIQQQLSSAQQKQHPPLDRSLAEHPKHADDAATTLQRLQQEWLQVVFGEGITSISQRQAFVEEFGCTGWTDEVVSRLLDVAGDRGLVEIGAGNGQWARHLTQAYRERKRNGERDIDQRERTFDFVLAYDDGSALPMKPTKRDIVRPLIGNSVPATIRQWSCRNRVLLLVYPPPDSNMAYEAVKAYDEIHSNANTTAAIVYVGEGRGGLNANEAFFDYLRDHDWYVHTVLPVRSFGTKGKEQMYLLLRREKS